jgi:hypothetical protein
MRNIFVSLGFLVLGACGEAIPNRADAPEAAFHAARAGLKNHDLRVYFDSLTDAAARNHLANSVTICLAGTDPAAVAAGLKQSTGCQAILQRHGWPSQGAKTPGQYQSAVAEIRNPRAMAQELEENHRKFGVGSSFVWEYLDTVKVSDIVVRGSYATGVAEWNTQEKRPIKFVKDETGWRFDPMVGEP